MVFPETSEHLFSGARRILGNYLNSLLEHSAYKKVVGIRGANEPSYSRANRDRIVKSSNRNRF